MGIFILIVILGLGFIVYYSKIKMEINYKRAAKHDKGEVKLSGLGGLIQYRLSIPAIDFKDVDEGVKVESNQESSTKKKGEDTFINKDKIEIWYENYEVLLHRVKHFQESLRWFMAHVHCNKWEWKTDIGTGDAAEAGVLTGLIWGVKTTILGFISHYIQWDREPKIEVTPCFQQSVLDTSFEANFSVTLGRVIRFLLLLWFRLKRSSDQPYVSSKQRTSNL